MFLGSVGALRTQAWERILGIGGCQNILVCPKSGWCLFLFFLVLACLPYSRCFSAQVGQWVRPGMAGLEQVLHRLSSQALCRLYCWEDVLTVRRLRKRHNVFEESAYCLLMRGRLVGEVVGSGGPGRISSGCPKWEEVAPALEGQGRSAEGGPDTLTGRRSILGRDYTLVFSVLGSFA